MVKRYRRLTERKLNGRSAKNRRDCGAAALHFDFIRPGQAAPSLSVGKNGPVWVVADTRKWVRERVVRDSRATLSVIHLDQRGFDRNPGRTPGNGKFRPDEKAVQQAFAWRGFTQRNELECSICGGESGRRRQEREAVESGGHSDAAKARRRRVQPRPSRTTHTRGANVGRRVDSIARDVHDGCRISPGDAPGDTTARRRAASNVEAHGKGRTDGARRVIPCEASAAGIQHIRLGVSQRRGFATQQGLPDVLGELLLRGGF